MSRYHDKKSKENAKEFRRRSSFYYALVSFTFRGSINFLSRQKDYVFEF